MPEEAALAVIADAGAEYAATEVIADFAVTEFAGAELAGDALMSGIGDGMTGTLGEGIGSYSMDAVGNMVATGQNFAFDAAGPGFTYDQFGTIIPNDAAASIQAAQTSSSMAANMANGLDAGGGLTSSQYAQAANAVRQGMSVEDAARKVLGNAASPQNIARAAASLASGAGNALGAAGKAGAATASAGQIAAGAVQAASVQSNAATQAATLQSNAAKTSGDALAAAALKSSGLQAQGALTAAGMISGGVLQATGLQAENALRTGDIMSNAYNSSGNLNANAATAAGAGLADASRTAGFNMAVADSQAAQQLAGGYRNAADMVVGGNNAAIQTANSTLASQKDLLNPYLTAGQKALDTLSSGLADGGRFSKQFTMADAQNMPAYQFALQEGTRAINNAAAAGGTQLSSANAQSLGKYASDTAAQYEQQAFNQWLAQNNLTLSGLQNMVQTGQVSAKQLDAALSMNGLSIGTLQRASAAAQAEGEMGASKSLAAGIKGAAAHNSAGNLQAAQATATSGQQAAGFRSAGNLGAAQATSNALTGHTNSLASGLESAAKSNASGLLASNSYTAQGMNDAEKAYQAGNVGSAAYQAGGIVSGANATAQGIVAAANAGAAGTIANGNIYGSMLSNIGNQLAGNNALGNIFSQKADTPGSSTNPAVADVPGGGVPAGTPGSDTSDYADINPPIPVDYLGTGAMDMDN